tara:strand:+ start:242 stop:478 length:237 start_codon:yes stop_codon:yes gene_type:complete
LKNVSGGTSHQADFEVCLSVGVAENHGVAFLGDVGLHDIVCGGELLIVESDIVVDLPAVPTAWPKMLGSEGPSTAPER